MEISFVYGRGRPINPPRHLHRGPTDTTREGLTRAGARGENKRGRARRAEKGIGRREGKHDGGWRSSRVHLARLMHRTGSSNGRVGHEYLINNYYRETLYFCEKKESRDRPPPPPPSLLACTLARSLPRRGPRTPPSLSFNLAFSLPLPSAIVPDSFPRPCTAPPYLHIYKGM